MGYKVEPLPEFMVFIGIGKFFVCNRVCQLISILLQNTNIMEDLFVLKLGGMNIVLGLKGSRNWVS